ncbi:hypothetical protein ACFLRZ_04405 [Bacteroidota bacterium]
MNSKNKYDPEDIESLLLNKDFRELYKEEKEFVLRHIESEEEYNAMRKAILNITIAKKEDIPLTPDPSIKNDLIAAFEESSHYKHIRSFSLNQLFASFNYHKRPAFQIAFASIILLFVTYFIFIKPDRNQENLMVEERKEQEIEKISSGNNNEKNQVEERSDRIINKAIESDKVSSDNKIGDLRESDLLAYKTPVENEIMEVTEDSYMPRSEKNLMPTMDNNKKEINADEVFSDKETTISYGKDVAGETISSDHMDKTKMAYTSEIQEETISLTAVSAKKSNINSRNQKGIKAKRKIKSRTLNEDAALIYILYTAL